MNAFVANDISPPSNSYVERYQKGEWRAPIFQEMVLNDMRALGPPQSLTVLDIGCGKGFDDEPQLQEQLAAESAKYIGVEPDEQIEPRALFTSFHHCLLENAPIEPASIDIAFSVMVIEHLETPQLFWDRLHDMLRPGGVVWGFTIDSRNWFSSASSLTKHIGIKDWYLNRIHGQAGADRYENYPVYYRSNTPKQLEQLTAKFSSMDIWNFHRIGQLDYYLPRVARWAGRGVDRYIQYRKLPGSVMAVRVVK